MLFDNIYNSNILSAEEGFLRGNMFDNEYKSYKDKTYLPIKVNDDKEYLLINIMKYSFAINDLNLYLDIYPDNKEAFNLFNEYISKLNILEEEYIKMYGPLEINTVEDKFLWLNDFPFDLKGGKYV